MADPAERHRVVAARFGEVMDGVGDWDAATPVPGWVASDVVEHLTTWLPGLLSSGAGVELRETSSWAARCEEVQALLERRDDQHWKHSLAQAATLAEAIDRFYTTDVFLHSWDLAAASGQDDPLDPDHAEELLAGLRPVEEMLRSSGQYGPAVEVSPARPIGLRLMGFLGRDAERWYPACGAARHVET